LTTVCTGALLALVWLLPLAAQDNALRRIQDRFVAPCCWRQSVAIHNSEAAAQMRSEIAHLVAAGKSEDQIVEFYVARYGERILREPRGSKLIASIVVPSVMFIGAAACLLVYIRRLRRAPTPIARVADLPTLLELDLD
jgi:cytochrome c-type biogenesis protein CcmH